ncbi:MAG: acyl-ACP--UDP-N- acetylglucosamine O-acyltransferase [Acetobacter sp.]|uniref:acyl-ACP--UDP-N- acetylglucosamine O-acyltransferase n=1 Tax=Acetobacter sp. TaxID=440 RepID=UPI0039E7CB85
MSADIWYIYGAGGLGVETMDMLQNAIRQGTEKAYRLAFLVDDPRQAELMGLPVVAVGSHVSGARVTIAVGEPSARAMLAEKVGTLGLVLASVVSPLAFVSSHAQLGNGVIIAPYVSVQATAKVGNNVAVNTASILGHDVVVEDNTVISSQVSLGGGVHVEALGYVGMGALIKEKLHIGSSSIIGMGSVVHSDVPSDVIVLGNPGRVVRRNEDKKVFR